MLTYKIFLAVDESTHRETILDAEGPISELLPRKCLRQFDKMICSFTETAGNMIKIIEGPQLHYCTSYITVMLSLSLVFGQKKTY